MQDIEEKAIEAWLKIVDEKIEIYTKEVKEFCFWTDIAVKTSGTFMGLSFLFLLIHHYLDYVDKICISLAFLPIACLCFFTLTMSTIYNYKSNKAKKEVDKV